MSAVEALAAAAPAEGAAGRFSIVCLSSQEWSEELPTNRQQIMLRAARRGHRVLFVETGGFIGRHLVRLVAGGDRRSLVRRLLRTERVAPGIDARKALNLLPWGQKHRLPNRVNALATRALVRRVARRLPGPVVLWIYDPAAVVVPRRRRWVTAYDCVDDYAEQAPDARRRALLARADGDAARAATLVFATTRPLYERQLRLNPRTYHVPNVGDYGHFAPAADRSLAAPEAASLRRPVLGFAGNFLAAKVDLELLEHVAGARPEWSLLLIGPARPDTEQQLARLARMPNVTWLGPRPYAELPRYVAAFDVALIPYRSNAYTECCFPLKLYEYLAAGKPVVAAGLPALRGLEPDVLVAEHADAFVLAAGEALQRRTDADRERRMRLAARNTWETRTERLLSLVETELER